MYYLILFVHRIFFFHYYMSPKMYYNQLVDSNYYNIHNNYVKYIQIDKLMLLLFDT